MLTSAYSSFVFALCSDIACSNAVIPNGACGVLCGGSASILRGFVTRVYSLDGSVSDPGCCGGQLVDNVGPSPVCTSNTPDTPYM